MNRLNFFRWFILILFSILLGYFGIHAFHFSQPILFILIVIAGVMVTVFSFSFFKNTD